MDKVRKAEMRHEPEAVAEAATSSDMQLARADLQALREQLWMRYGSSAQQAWCEQLAGDEPDGDPTEFDPNDPF
jgi:hypothetical protein